MYNSKMIAGFSSGTSRIDIPSGYSSGFNIAGGFQGLVQNTINAIFTIGGIAFFVYTLYGGIRYLTAAGDEKSLKEAQKILSNGFIGIAIIAGSAIIVKIVGTILGVDILNPTFGSN